MINVDEDKPIQINTFNLSSSSSTLDLIFASLDNEYLSIITSHTEINQLPIFLKNTQIPIKEKILLLTALTKLFINSNWIVPMLRDLFEKEKHSLYKLLIDIYLNSNNAEASQISYECLSLLVMNTTCLRENYEKVYQSLAMVYHNNEHCALLTKERLINHIQLLKLFYSGNTQQNNQIKAKKNIKNYIYFSGKGSSLITEIKTVNQEGNYIKLSDGFYLTFWFWIDSDIAKAKDNLNINLVNIAFDIGQIKINLPQSLKQIRYSFLDNKLDLDAAFNLNDWNHMSIRLTSKRQLLINLNGNNLYERAVKDITADSKITNMIFFENFIGKVTSVVFINNDIGEKNPFNHMPYGLYKDKYIYKILRENKPEYLRNSDSIYDKDHSLPSSIKSKDQDKKDHYEFLDAKRMKELKQQMIIYCPFAFDPENNKLDDLCNNFSGSLGLFNGTNMYRSYNTNIEYLGGLNALLPILELMYTSITCNKSNYKSLTTILDTDTFYQFLELLSVIVINKPKNLENAEQTKFFSYLALFLEQFPDKIFDKNILQKLLDIINMDVSINVKDNQSTQSNSKSTFFEKIILNEKIIAKFSPELQGELWKKMNYMIESNVEQSKKFFNVFAICTILKFYDSNKENKFCCKKHASLFEIPDIESKIIVPDFYERTRHLLKSMEFILNTTQDDKDLIDLIHFLTLDLSPCLQKVIIKRITAFFYYKKDNIFVSPEIKKAKGAILNNILKQNGFEILLYSLSVALLDVRCKIINLLIALINDYSQSFESLLSIDSFVFITKNVLPFNLIYQKYLPFKENKQKLINNTALRSDENDELIQPKSKFIQDGIIKDEGDNNNIKQIEPKPLLEPQREIKLLTELFNKEVYEEELSSMWKILFKWFKQITSPVNALSQHVLIFLIQLCIATDIKFTVSVSDILLGKLTFNISPLEIQEYASNEYIYNWLIETIFIYSFKLNIPNSDDSFISKTLSNLKSILKIAMENQISDQDNTNKIMQLFSYADYFHNANPNNITLTSKTNLLRELIQIVLASPLNFNNKTKICFAFLLQNNSTFAFSSENISLGEINKIVEGIFDNMKPNFDLEASLFQTQWKDFFIFDKILDFYLSELSIQSIYFTLKIKANTKEANTPDNLLNQCLNKKKTGKLINKCYHLLSQQNNNVSIMKIIVILLSVYYYNIRIDEIIGNEIANKYKDFLIFCILVSINADPMQEEYDQIQNEFFSLISFGLAFLRLNKVDYYNQIVNDYIRPILIEGNKQIADNHSSGIMKLFSSNKNPITASALFVMFISVKKLNKDDKEEEKIKMRDAITFDNFIHLDDYMLFLKEQLNAANQSIRILYNNNDYNNNSVIKEKEKISEIIKKIIPNFEVKLKERSTGEYLEHKIIRHSYKKVKKKLFSWRGLWSDRYSFFDKPYLIKQKTINHITSEMTKVLLGPILDIDYYLPQFLKFNPKNLFMPNNHHYRVYLDIDSILTKNDLDKDKNDKVKDKEKNEEANTMTYLTDCYRLNYPEIWEKTSISNSVIDLEKTLSIAETKSMLIKSLGDEKLSDCMYNCCIVKPMTHNKGLIVLESKMLRFVITTPTKEEIKESIEKGNLHYDEERKTCYGSFLLGCRKRKDKYYFKLKYSSIKFFLKRVYFYAKTGLEFFTFEHKSYYLNFETPNDMEKFVNDLLKKVEDPQPIKINSQIIGYQVIAKSNKDKKSLMSLEKLQQDWSKWKISNMEYLMWINILSNRSFDDISQYPVFPWVITNYKEQFNEDEILNSDIRDFQLPMGMLLLNNSSIERKQRYLDQYEIMKQDYDENIVTSSESEIQLILTNQKPYLYGSHYSNPAYVSHYLTRIFPFSTTMIEIQGSRFDDPERLFNSIIRSFDCSISQKCDVRELIPEFFCFPEMFININNLDLAQEEEVDLNRKNFVILPKWAKSHFDFVSKQRITLEHKEVNKKIRFWIDLIFGVYQKGKKAEEKNNVFMAHTYENSIKLNQIVNKEEKDTVLRLVEMGLSPNQIFIAESIIKEECIYSKAVNESNELIMSNLKLNNLKGKKVLKMKLHGNEHLLFVLNDCYIVANFVYKSENNDTVYEKKPVPFLNESTISTIKYKMNRFYGEGDERETNRPILNYSRGTIVVLGGFWDGRIEITDLSAKQNQPGTIKYCYFDNISPVVVMEIDKTETLVICGTSDGRVNVFTVDRVNWKLKKKLYHHDREVTGIAINNTLNMFATCAKDGYIMLYLLPSNRLIRAIRLDHGLTGDCIFLSALPLPEILIQNKKSKTLFIFNINGRLVKYVSQGCNEAATPITFTSSTSYCDYLMYGTDKGTIVQYSYPMFERAIVRNIKENMPIQFVEFSEDNSFCYVWFGNDEIFVMHDRYVYVQDVTMTLNSFGFFV